MLVVAKGDCAVEKSTEVLTVREAGAVLKLSRATIYKRVAEGVIPTVRIGKLLRVPRAELDQLLANARKQEGG
jgi:excisionase family DNA binding protein